MTAENFMLYVDGSELSFRCDCGGNVFQKVVAGKKPKFRCNSCDAVYTGEYKEQLDLYKGK